MLDPLGAADVVTAVGVTLVNFLWQAALIGLVTAVVLAACPRATAGTRYGIACIGLLAMTAAPAITLALVWRTPASTSVVDAAVAADTAASVLAGAAVVTGLDTWLPDVVWTWAIVVTFLTMRLAHGWWRTERMRRRDAQQVSDDLAIGVQHLATRIGIARRVSVLRSPRVDVPAVIGWIRPTILLPIGALTGLSTQQLDAVLSHELAHIRRHDYLVNSLQHVVETLFFFHPSVWWLSRQVRIEREHCCDDVAVETCGSAVVYARALAALEEARVPHVRLALAATDGSLVARVRRLVGPAGGDGRQPALPIAACVVVIMFGVSLTSRAAAPTPAAVQVNAAAAEAESTARLARYSEYAQRLGPVQAQQEPAVVAPPAPPPPPVRVGGNIRPPSKTFDVAPVYPQAAREAGIEGLVILESTIDTDGSVANIRVLRSIPDLDQAAIDAVRRWKYEPTLLNGTPVAVLMTVTVNFSLKPTTSSVVNLPAGQGGSAARLSRTGTSRPPRVGGNIVEPRKVRDVPPVYPQIALAAGVSGMVILEAEIDAEGNVVNLAILRSVPMLDQAAIDAVRQWKYEPPLLNGIPTAVVMTVTVNFTLN